MDEVQGFYDSLTAHYHLLFADWDAAVRRQGAVLDRLIADLAGSGRKRILDAACGIGTQAIGLALQGHEVTGTDLSPAAVARAGREAARLGAALYVRAADLRCVQESVQGPFDVVCVLDNALPHLRGDGEIASALRALAELLAPGGLLLASVRDYDTLLTERPRLVQPRVLEEADGYRIVFQVWDWDGDGASYAVHQYLVQHGTAGTPQARVFSGRYWPVTRARLSALAEGADFAAYRWFDPDATGFHQPILAARLHD